MRRGLVVLGLLALCTTGHSADPVNVELKIGPGGHVNLMRLVERNQTTKVLAIGDGHKGYCGLYVYDGHGNCISWDDSLDAAVQDDLAVEFFASQAGPYHIEVHNMGSNVNSFSVVVK